MLANAPRHPHLCPMNLTTPKTVTLTTPPLLAASFLSPPPRPLSPLLSHHKRGSEYKLCFSFFIWVAYNAVGQRRIGDGSECALPKEKGGNNRLVKQLYRQKNERTMRRGNRDALRDRKYVVMNGRCMNRERQEQKTQRQKVKCW